VQIAVASSVFFRQKKRVCHQPPQALLPTSDQTSGIVALALLDAISDMANRSTIAGRVNVGFGAKQGKRLHRTQGWRVNMQRYQIVANRLKI
jgi:hypothetical protein